MRGIVVVARRTAHGSRRRDDAGEGPSRQQIFRVVNVPMRGLLSLPFATPISRRLMLVHDTGRKSSRAYASP